MLWEREKIQGRISNLSKCFNAEQKIENRNVFNAKYLICLSVITSRNQFVSGN